MPFENNADERIKGSVEDYPMAMHGKFNLPRTHFREKQYSVPPICPARIRAREDGIGTIQEGE